jgi:hypothetical protein
MGMRQNIQLNYHDGNNVYIYSHWDGGEDPNKSPLANKVRTALARNQRWDDESYLARIIMSEVIREELDAESGYGLAPYDVDPEYPTIVVDLKNRTVNDIPYDKFVRLYGEQD